VVVVDRNGTLSISSDAAGKNVVYRGPLVTTTTSFSTAAARTRTTPENLRQFSERIR
jgi:hypothetical protein